MTDKVLFSSFLHKCLKFQSTPICSDALVHLTSLVWSTFSLRLPQVSSTRYIVKKEKKRERENIAVWFYKNNASELQNRPQHILVLWENYTEIAHNLAIYKKKKCSSYLQGIRKPILKNKQKQMRKLKTVHFLILLGHMS